MTLIAPSAFRLEDVAEMLDQTPAVLLPAVEETMAAGITTAGENEFSFRHQLLRRAVGDMIPQPGRKALHRQYGQILLNRGESAALAASHLLQAADPGNPASLADLDAAAEQTLRSAPQTAADLASRVLELTPPGDPDALPRAVAAASELVAQGLNNRQVAGRMYVSEHTVAFYLRQAFRKLAIGSRVQLARIVIEQRPAPCTADTAAS